MTLDRFQGSLLGLALGDALGAPHEGGPLERLVWGLIGKTRSGETRWTDDTQMTINLIESIVDSGGVDQDDLARRFSASYRWSRGYGPGAAKLLKKVARGKQWQEASRSVYRDGSFGNGGAMRAPAIGLYYSSAPALIETAARKSAEVTHAHPLAQQGAVLIAVATSCAVTDRDRSKVINSVTEHCSDSNFRLKWEIAAGWLERGEEPNVKTVAKTLGNGISAIESCVTSIYLALRYLDEAFEDLIGAAIEGKGDTDTIGAMSGAIWGAANGLHALPGKRLKVLEGQDRLLQLGESLFQKRHVGK